HCVRTPQPPILPPFPYTTLFRSLLDSGALGPLPERSARMVHVARSSSERLSRLVDDILDIERMDSGTTPLERTDHPVAELAATRSEEHTSELQSRENLVCRLLLE